MRSRLSISGVWDLVLFRRGEVRRVRVVVARVLCFSAVFVDFDEDEERDVFEDIAVSGDRARVAGAGCGAGCGAFSGEEKVRSRVSITSDERRNAEGVGIGASSNMLVVSRGFVGV